MVVTFCLFDVIVKVLEPPRLKKSFMFRFWFTFSKYLSHRIYYILFCISPPWNCINDFWENREWIPRKPRAWKGGKIGTPIHFTFLARNKLEASERKTHFLVVKNYEMGNIEEKPARHLSIADFVISLRFTRMDCVCVAITAALKKDCRWMPQENNV